MLLAIYEIFPRLNMHEALLFFDCSFFLTRFQVSLSIFYQREPNTDIVITTSTSYIQFIAIFLNPGPWEPLSCIFQMFSLLKQAWFKWMGHWQTCAHLDDKLKRYYIHLNLMCWSKEMSKTYWGVIARANTEERLSRQFSVWLLITLWKSNI